MPVIVIGADTPLGAEVTAALSGRAGEVRAFVTDPAAAQTLRDLGVKVAIGDVSDASHIDGAARRAFAAVIIADSAEDGRERSFASSPSAVHAAWAEGLKGAAIQRLIWVGPGAEVPAPLAAATPERAAVDTTSYDPEQIAAEVARLDDLASLEGATEPG